MISDVGIDLDGVLYDFSQIFQEYCEERMGILLSAPTRWNFYLDWGLTDDQFASWLDDATKTDQIFNRSKPMKNVREGWDSLREQGLTLHILTHRHPVAYKQTIDWLTEYDLLPDTLHFGATKTILSQLGKGTCAAIDDHIPFYTEYVNKGILAFLHTHPWNEAENALRADDLLDFANKIKIYNEYHSFYKNRPISKPTYPVSEEQKTNIYVNPVTKSPYSRMPIFRNHSDKTTKDK